MSMARAQAVAQASRGIDLNLQLHAEDDEQVKICIPPFTNYQSFNVLEALLIVSNNELTLTTTNSFSLRNNAQSIP